MVWDKAVRFRRVAGRRFTRRAGYGGSVATAVLATVAVAASTLVATPAFALDETVDGPLTPVADVTPLSIPADPVVVSVLEEDDDQPSGGGSHRVGLDGTVDGHASALVRVTVTNPSHDTTVVTGSDDDPSTLLSVAAGTTASTTSLFPVEDGTVSLWSTDSAAVTVEVVAAFDGDPRIPGSTIALPTPVTRADTARGLAGYGLQAGIPFDVGVTGEGGVSPENVRAVYANVTVETDRATRLTVAGTAVSLPAGRSTFTSLFAPDRQGMIAAELSTGSASVRLDVVGWIPDADSDLAAANAVGSFVTRTDSGVSRTVSAGPECQLSEEPVEVSETTDTAYSLVLVSAAPSATATHLSFGTGGSAGGDTDSGAGLSVDPGIGALPQLAVAPVTATGSVLSSSGSTVSATIVPLGSFLSAAVPTDGPDPRVIISSPRSQSEINLADNGDFLLSGTVDTPGAALDRIEISTPQAGLIGTAAILNTDADGLLAWEFRASAPDDGEFDYTATAIDRAGKKSTDAVTIAITAPTSDDLIVSSRTVVVNSDPDRPQMRAVAPNVVAFSTKPDVEAGDVIVSDAAVGLPDGYFGRVVAINRQGDEWWVSTHEATVTEVFYQADLHEHVTLDDPNAIRIGPPPAPPQDDDIEYIGDASNGTGVELVSGDDVDVTERSEPPAVDTTEQSTFDEDDLAQMPMVEQGLRTQGTTKGSFDVGPSISHTMGIKAAFKIEWKNNKAAITNLSSSPEDQRDEADASIRFEDDGTKVGAAVMLSAEAQLTLSATIVISVSLKTKWKVIPTGVTVNEFTVKLGSKLKASVSFKAAIAVQKSVNFAPDLASFTLPTVRFLAGVVPVVITNKGIVGMMLNANLEAAVSVPLVGITREDSVGFTYSSEHGLKKLDSKPKITYDNSVFTSLPGATSVGLKGELAFGPVIRLEGLLYGIIGPQLYTSAQVGVKADLAMKDFTTKSTSLNVEAFLAIKLGGKAQLKILKWTPVDITVAETGFRFTLFSKKFEIYKPG